MIVRTKQEDREGERRIKMRTKKEDRVSKERKRRRTDDRN